MPRKLRLLRQNNLSTMSILLAMLASVCLVLPAHASDRALVIGNGEYRELPLRETAVADAEAYAEFLSRQRFQVTLHRNLTLAGLEDATLSFLESIEAGDKVLFAYFGHGWNDGTTNYVVGTDALRRGRDAGSSRSSFPLSNALDSVLANMTRRKPEVTIAIVDANAEYPFSGRRRANTSSFQGMTSVDPDDNSFLIFSAAPGQVVRDGQSSRRQNRNGVFARAFLRPLRSGATFREAASQAKRQVERLAGRRGLPQTPVVYDTVSGSTCFTTRCGTVAPAQPPRASPHPPVSGLGALTAFIPEAAFHLAKLVGTVAAWDEFLRNHPTGPLADRARDERARHFATAQPQRPGSRPPPRVPANTGITSDQTFRIVRFVTEDVLTVDLADPAAVRSLYADWVVYNDRGLVRVSEVVAGKAADARRWRSISQDIVPGTFEAGASDRPGVYNARFEVAFRASDFRRSETGVSKNWLSIDLRGRAPRIVAEDSLILERSNAAVLPPPRRRDRGDPRWWDRN